MSNRELYYTLNLTTIDLDTLVNVVDTARQHARNHPGWLNAIDRASTYLLTSQDTIRIAQDGTALIPSATRSATYSANGVCQCQAFTHHLPCWHRAAARLITRYREALEARADQLMHLVDAAEQRDDWASWERLNQQWEAAEMKLAEVLR
jgi:hypothetical protein